MGLISDQIRETARKAIDALMAPQEEGGLGKRCRLHFEARKLKCPNCGWDAANKRSNNVYRTGGPQPFPNGSLCPTCMGKGVLETPVTKTIVMLCNWNAKTWVAIPNLDLSNVNLQVPGGAVQTKGMVEDLDDVLQSRRMTIETTVAALRGQQFVLEGQPGEPGNIIQGEYFMAVWTRGG